MPETNKDLARTRSAEIAPARAAARALPAAAAAIAREVSLLPARGWLLAERVDALTARTRDAGTAVSALLEQVWELAAHSEARVRHIQHTALGPERTEWVLSPQVEALIARGVPPAEAQAARDSEPMVTLQTGGLLSSHEAVALEVDLPESRVSTIIEALERVGSAGRDLAAQLKALPGHALPLRPGVVLGEGDGGVNKKRNVDWESNGDDSQGGADVVDGANGVDGAAQGDPDGEPRGGAGGGAA